jgi:hypothetical protein
VIPLSIWRFPLSLAREVGLGLWINSLFQQAAYFTDLCPAFSAFQPFSMSAFDLVISTLKTV